MSATQMKKAPYNSYVEELQRQDAKARTEKFHKLVGFAVAALIATGATYLVLKDPSDWEGWSKTVATATPAQKTNSFDVIEKQKLTTQTYYLQNKTAVVELNRLDDVAKALKLDVGQYMRQNEKLYSTTMDSLNRDKVVLDKLYTMNPEDKLIKKEYFNEENIRTFTGYQSNSLERSKAIVNLHTNIIDKTKELNQIKDEVISNVQKTLPKFNVDAAEKNFLNAAGDEVGNNKSQIQNAKNAGDLEDSDYKELISSTNEAYSAMEKTIGEDKQKVTTLVQTAQTSPQASSHFSFMDYWLLSQWMNSSGSYNSGYQAGAASARYNSVGTGGSYHSLYSANNPTTKAAQKWSQVSSKAGTPNYNTLSQKIAQTRTASMSRISEARASSARASSARTASVSRGGFGGGSHGSGGG